MVQDIRLPSLGHLTYRLQSNGDKLLTGDTIIPIYEYSCQDCDHHFEALVRGEQTPACPECQSSSLERQFSLPSARTSTTRGMAMRAARTRDQRQGAERMHAQREYELNHDDH